jgi:hypothetical protein
MTLLRGLILGGLTIQALGLRLCHIDNIQHGLSQLGIEGVPLGLLPLDLEPTFHGLPDCLDGGSLQDLALAKGTDHALTTRAWGSD